MCVSNEFMIEKRITKVESSQWVAGRSDLSLRSQISLITEEGERQKQIPLREKEREGEREREGGSEKKQIFVSLAFAWTSENPLNRTASLEDGICVKEIRARVK